MPSINMLFTSTLALLSTVAVAAPVTKRADCSTPVRVITVRGSYEVFGQSSLQKVYSDLLGKGLHGQLQGTPYPAQMDNNNPAVYESSVAQGISSLIGIVEQAARECPNQKLVLLGYSQGAAAVGNALCGNTNAPGGAMISQAAGKNVAAAVLFGDPSHTMGQTFVFGGALKSGMVPRYQNMDCSPYTSRMASYCHPDDPVCALGYDYNAHTSYMANDANSAADWIMGKL